MTISFILRDARNRKRQLRRLVLRSSLFILHSSFFSHHGLSQAHDENVRVTFESCGNWTVAKILME